VVWNQQTVPSDVYSPWKLKARLRTARGAWRPTATLAQSASGVLPKVAVDARGEALAAWKTQPPSQQAGARFRPAGLRSVETRGGRWSTPLRINPSSQDLRDLDENVEIAVDDAGRATAVWTILQGGVWAARKPPRGAWGQAIRLSAAEGYSDAFPTAAGDGRTIVTWVEHVRGVRTAEAGPGRSWQPAVTLDPAAVASGEGASPGHEPSVATAGRQRAIVWTAFEDAPDGGRTVLKAAFAAP